MSSRLLAYGEISSIPSNVWSTITFTKDSLVDHQLTQVMGSGNICGEWGVFVNGDRVSAKRSGGDRNVDFVYNDGFQIRAQKLVEVKVIHYKADQLGKFEASIHGR